MLSDEIDGFEEGGGGNVGGYDPRGIGVVTFAEAPEAEEGEEEAEFVVAEEGGGAVGGVWFDN